MAASKLRIKLKVVHDGDKQNKDKAMDDDCICKLCGKEFMSLKAVGGHMRVHQEHNGVAGAGEGSYSRKNPNFRLLMKEGKPTCPHCSKSFPTEKSLFGHMRCHPERGYRGMFPPESESFDEDQIFKGAVFALMLMSTGHDCYRNLDSDKGDNLGKKRKREINQISDLDEGKCYKCSVCDKVFETHQALGGHKSSAHNKIPIKKIDETDEFEATAAALVLSSSVSESGHICKICDKVFASGQALGGHMRRHYTGGTGDVAGKVEIVEMHCDGDHQSVSSGAATADDDTSQLQVVGFDLNQLPAGDVETDQEKLT